MRKSFNKLLLLLGLAALFTNCRKENFDSYYGRPVGLAPPIYQQLETKGNFKHVLKIIEKAGYKDILGKAGSWTFFAPTDEAFEKYMQENGIPNIDSINVETARKIATYGLVYNPYRKNQLTSYQTSLGPDTNSSYRRKTAYYDFVYTENGKKVVNNSGNGINYIATENNNKYIPYFIQSYFSKNGLDPSNYAALYPNKPFSGFNVADASVIEADVPAENGIIHIIDKVVLPLPNIEQYITSKPAYSEFKKLLDKQVLYILNADLTRRYNVLTGSTESVYLKAYKPGLSFSPINENYQTSSTDGQSFAWSIAVPTNEQLLIYTGQLLEHYKTFEAAPPSVLLNFINSHMWKSTLWPERVTGENNSIQELATFEKTNVIDQKVLSNGNFYGLNKVNEANVFRTVYSKAYLNPAYSLMTRAIDQSELRVAMISPNMKYTLFLISNTDVAAAGYNYNEDIPAWGYTGAGVSTDYSAVSTTRVNRLVQTSLLTTPNGEFDNLAGVGIAEAYNGEYVKFTNNRVFASGNIADGTSVTVNENKKTINGQVYYANGVLKFAENNVNLGSSLEKLATSINASEKSRFSHFFDYLKSTTLWNNGTKVITGVESGSFYTLFVPTNIAIEQAVKEGQLPGNKLTGMPSFNAATLTAAQKSVIEKFILYSIISKATIAVDGKKAGKYQTLLKTATGDSRLITVKYNSAGNNPSPDTFELQDDSSTPTKSSADYLSSNNLSNRALIHSINKVLKF